MIPPSPKELLIIDSGIGFLAIYTESDGASKWIEQEAPIFGEFIKSDTARDCYALLIRPTYNRTEVIQYLLSYIDNEEFDNLILNL